MTINLKTDIYYNHYPVKWTTSEKVLKVVVVVVVRTDNKEQGRSIFPVYSNCSLHNKLPVHYMP